MKYITLHETQADFNSKKDSFIMPHVAYVVENNTVDYKPYVHDYSQDYLTFTATESGTFKFSGNSINYSVDNGETWTSLASNTNSPTVNAGDKIMWKASGLTPPYNGIGTFSSTGQFTVEGNVMSLHFGDNFSGQTSLSGKNYAFRYLFSGCTGVTSAENLSLPATTLAGSCYDSMFYGCTNLVTAPELPAITLATYCYQSMFYGCTNLVTAPELPATTLATSCYNSMFMGCTSLTTAPELPATTLVSNCYSQMFTRCTSLTTAPELPATTMAASAYTSMFNRCTSLTTAPELPATTLTSQCYYGMFQGCTNLTTAPVLPATTLADSCYRYMFKDCTNLSSITCLATNISADSCTSNWVTNVSSSGTFTKAASMSSWTTGDSGIPTNWTVQDAS